MQREFWLKINDNRQHENNKNRCKDNTKMDFREIVFEDAN
jgi:hypothetical protein